MQFWAGFICGVFSMWCLILYAIIVLAVRYMVSKSDRGDMELFFKGIKAPVNKISPGG